MAEKRPYLGMQSLIAVMLRPYQRKIRLVSQTHTAGGFSAQVDPDAQKVSRTGSFATLAADAIFRARRRGYLTGFAAIPGNHLQHV